MSNSIPAPNIYRCLPKWHTIAFCPMEVPAGLELRSSFHTHTITMPQTAGIALLKDLGMLGLPTMRERYRTARSIGCVNGAEIRFLSPVKSTHAWSFIIQNEAFGAQFELIRTPMVLEESRLIMYGGWANKWLDDCWQISVSSIVGRGKSMAGMVVISSKRNRIYDCSSRCTAVVP